MSTYKNPKNRAGFTLVELLVVVAILVVACMVAIPAVARYQKALTAEQLDGNAQSIFSAAQGRLAALRSVGKAQPLEDAPKVDSLPADYPEGTDAGDLRYLDSGDAGHAAMLELLLPAGTIEDKLRQGRMVVEFDLGTGAVYGVFYAESGFTYPLPEGEESALRIQAQARREHDPVLGYYGGNVVRQMEAVPVPQPAVTVSNAEELTLTVTMPVDLGRLSGGGIRMELAAVDAAGRELELFKDANLYAGGVGTVVLDTYKSYPTQLLTGTGWTAGKSFRSWVGAREFDMANDVTLRLTTSYDGDIRTTSSVVQVTVNPLFDSGKDGAVRLSCGRHLQNLATEVSGVSGVTSAVQLRGISFKEDSPWVAAYGDTPFIPIWNSGLTAYDGGGQSVSGLKVAATGNAGLFAGLTGGTLSNVTLVDARISGTEQVGGLVGSLTNSAVSGCRVLLQSDLSGTAARVSGSGTYTGGLAGYTQNSVITNSFAATVVGGNACVGGLAGGMQGGSIQNSYSSCYLSADKSTGQAGGLAGSAEGTRFENAYSAVTVLAAKTGCGLAGGTPAVAAASCYAAVEYADDVAVIYGGAPSSSNVRYLAVSDSARVRAGSGRSAGSAALAARNFGASFHFSAEAGAGETVPYSLLGQDAAPPYPYPKLRALPHYGDWPLGEVDSITVCGDEAGTLPRRLVILPRGTQATVYAQPMKRGAAVTGQEVTAAVSGLPQGGVLPVTVAARDGGRAAVTIEAPQELAAGVYTVTLTAAGAEVEVLAVVCKVDLSLTLDGVTNTADTKNIYKTEELHKVITVDYARDCSVAVSPSWETLSAAATAAGCESELPTRTRWTSFKAGDPSVIAGQGTVLLEDRNTDGQLKLTVASRGGAAVALRWGADNSVKVTCPVQVSGGVQAMIHTVSLTQDSLTHVITAPAALNYPSQLVTTARANTVLKFALTTRVSGSTEGSTASYSWSLSHMDGDGALSPVAGAFDNPASAAPVLTLDGEGTYVAVLSYTERVAGEDKTSTDQVTLRVIRESTESSAGTSGINLTAVGGTGYAGGVLKLEQLDKAKDDGTRWNAAALTATAVGATDTHVRWYLGTSDADGEITGDHIIRRDGTSFTLDGGGDADIATVSLDNQGRLVVTALDRGDYLSDVTFPVYIKARDGGADESFSVTIMRKLLISPQASIENAGLLTGSKTIHFTANREESGWTPVWSIVPDMEYGTKGNMSVSGWTATGSFRRGQATGFLQYADYSNIVEFSCGPFTDDDKATAAVEIKGGSFSNNTQTINRALGGDFFLLEKGSDRVLSFAWGSGYRTKALSSYALARNDVLTMAPRPGSAEYTQDYQVTGLGFGTDQATFTITRQNAFSYPIHVVGVELPDALSVNTLGQTQNLTDISFYFPADPTAYKKNKDTPVHSKLTDAIKSGALTVVSSVPDVASVAVDTSKGAIRVTAVRYGTAVLTARYTVTVGGYEYSYSDTCSVNVSPAGTSVVRVEPVTDAAELAAVLARNGQTAPARAPVFRTGDGNYALMASPYTPDFGTMYFRCFIETNGQLQPLRNYYASSMNFYSENVQTALAEPLDSPTGRENYIYVRFTALRGSRAGDAVSLNAWFGAFSAESAPVVCYDEPHVTLTETLQNGGGDVTDRNHVFENSDMTPSAWRFTAREETPFYYSDGTAASAVRWEQSYPGGRSEEGFLTLTPAVPPELDVAVVMNPLCKVVLRAASTMVAPDATANCCATYGMVFIPDGGAE